MTKSLGRFIISSVWCEQNLALSILCRDSDMVMLVFEGHLLLTENWDKGQEEWRAACHQFTIIVFWIFLPMCFKWVNFSTFLTELHPSFKSDIFSASDNGITILPCVQNHNLEIRCVVLTPSSPTYLPIPHPNL